VFTPQAAALFLATGVGLFYYFRNEKAKQQERKRASVALLSWRPTLMRTRV
jgi:hypothetical protein